MNDISHSTHSKAVVTDCLADLHKDIGQQQHLQGLYSICHRIPLGAVAQSVEHRPRVREIMGSIPGGVKLMTYQIDTCHFLPRCSALLR